MDIRISSEAFEDGGMIPSMYTCDGDDISPPLSWDSVPEKTKSIALICDDPDAPMGTFVHWVLFNLPADIKGLEENISKEMMLENGAQQGISDFGKIGYGGPCPPGGTHRYFFKIYTIDTIITAGANFRKKDLENAMKGHILGTGQIIGRYKRQ